MREKREYDLESLARFLRGESREEAEEIGRQMAEVIMKGKWIFLSDGRGGQLTGRRFNDIGWEVKLPDGSVVFTTSINDYKVLA